MKTEGGRRWNQSNRKNKLYCRQVSMSFLKWTPSREEHKNKNKTQSPHGQIYPKMREKMKVKSAEVHLVLLYKLHSEGTPIPQLDSV
jgi:hypothetical protein